MKRERLAPAPSVRTALLIPLASGLKRNHHGTVRTRSQLWGDREGLGRCPTRAPPEKFARLGYAARGAVYLIIGGLALLAAVGSGGRATDSKGALQALLEAPFGGVLVAVVAIGFLCFAAWRLAQAFFDADRLGCQRKALIRRTAYGGSAAVYFGLAFTAASTLLGHHREGGDQSARDWTAALLSEPFGRSLVAAVGVAFAIGGLAIARRGWTDRFDRLALSPRRPTLGSAYPPCWVLSRALVCLIVAGFLMLAALHANSSDARGLAGALKSSTAAALRVGSLGGDCARTFRFRSVPVRHSRLPPH